MDRFYCTSQLHQNPNSAHHSQSMANSQYEYVKKFEQHPSLLPSTFIVVRIDGRGFHRFAMTSVHGMMPAPDVTRLSAKYGFEKPNDQRALELMNAAALSLMRELPDITMAYGVSDEYRLSYVKSSINRQLILAQLRIRSRMQIVRSKRKV